ncbi:protein MpC3H2 [Marchantia polymorpha subsp. ruderalis]|uniref:C3H1-type domain-containing protein n=2 Tax=Marchantia polymorpha TaxID=3197 RepID=A0AAF6AL06_MARPO|nr:hypothetical protein MARPO_0005s0287 [Marchantia polymorpha]BBM97126.1 hypothetical protein Mp_1g03200 [Marchantia polymorpha subsp. ruderalis]|eukprot:PTQ48679.1 hypothetical protein MARPO_0005s0287 [Marchantia polymorpha]
MLGQHPEPVQAFIPSCTLRINCQNDRPRASSFLYLSLSLWTLWSKQLGTMAVYEPVQKKARAYESNGNGLCNGNGTAAEQPSSTPINDERGDAGAPTSALGSKTKPCTKFFSTSGCPYGEGCHFLHYVPGGIVALGLAPLANVNGTGLVLGSAGVRNLLGAAGMSATQGGGAATVADPSVTVGGYKTRLCNRYNTPEGCRFGEKCHFAHGEADLRPSNNGRGSTGRSGLDYLQAGAAAAGLYANGHPSTAVASALFYGEPTPPGVTATGFGATSTTKISIEAAFAGAIIGKAGSNVKQISRLTGAKLSIREHETDPNMRNVEMEGSFEQIEHASEMVRQFLQNRDVVAPKAAALGSHNFKTKMCENFVQGTCTFADRCHFAHGAHELRVLSTMR